jgi:hypothetical protein
MPCYYLQKLVGTGDYFVHSFDFINLCKVSGEVLDGGHLHLGTKQNKGQRLNEQAMVYTTW